MAGAVGALHHVSISCARARLAVLERALVAGLRAGEPEAARQISFSFQDNLLDAAAAPHASTAYRAGFREQRRRLAARIGAPIIADTPDRLM